MIIIFLFITLLQEVKGNEITNGRCGYDCRWEIDENNHMRIYGSGLMGEWKSETEVPWNSEKERIISVTLEDSITNIGSYSFASCISMETISISNSVTSIGVNAFKKCESLKEITIPSSVTTIKGGVFSYCKSLKEVIIPSTVTQLETGSMFYESSLEHLTFEGDVESLGWNMFYNGCYLKTLHFKGNVNKARSQVFWNCNYLPSVIYEGTTIPTNGDESFVNPELFAIVESSYPGDTFLGLPVLKKESNGQINLSGSCGTSCTFTLEAISGEMIVQGSGSIGS